MTDAGHEAVLVSTESGTVQMFNHLDKAETRAVDLTVGEAKVEDFDALVLPGRRRQPGRAAHGRGGRLLVRTSWPRAVRWPRSATPRGRSSRPACSRGGASPRGRACRPDIRNAGGEWVDEALVIDGNLITSRNPDDLPQFCGAVVESLEHGAAAASA